MKNKFKCPFVGLQVWGKVEFGKIGQKKVKTTIVGQCHIIHPMSISQPPIL